MVEKQGKAWREWFRLTPKRLCMMGVLLAMQIVLSRMMNIQLSPSLRLNLGFLPTAVAGMLMGPFCSMLVAVCGDLLGATLFPSGALFPGFTITAALAGILKAYESAAGTELSAAAKAAAGSEMVLTGDLADIIGSDQAVELIAMVKQAIADYNLTDFDTLRPYVVEGARQLGVDLTDEQIDQITDLGVRIAQLDLDPEQLAGQLQGLVNNFQRLQNLSEQASGLWSRIESAFQGFWSWLTGLFR